MAGSRREIIKAKQRVFKDWGIKWDAAIEQQFQSEMAARPRADPEVILDNGIELDEASVVLQALGYILLDEELYPEEESK